MRWLDDGQQALVAPALPGDLAEVLHILDPSTGEGFPWRLPGLLLAALLWLWLRRRWRWEPPPPPAAPPKAPIVPSQGDSRLAAQIAELRGSVLISGQFRQGCHRLAELLRQRGEEVEGRPLSRWTAGEIAGYLGDSALSRVVTLLAELQFGRRVPNQSDFEGVCELAAEAGQEKRW